MEKLSDKQLEILLETNENTRVHNLASDLLQTRKELAGAKQTVTLWQAKVTGIIDYLLEHAPTNISFTISHSTNLLLGNEVLRERNQLRAELTALREQTRWIPVSERLPEVEDTEYLVARIWDKLIVQIALFDKGKWFYFYDEDWNEAGKQQNVTHWMPLPQPPEGGQNE